MTTKFYSIGQLDAMIKRGINPITHSPGSPIMAAYAYGLTDKDQSEIAPQWWQQPGKRLPLHCNLMCQGAELNCISDALHIANIPFAIDFRCSMMIDQKNRKRKGELWKITNIAA